MTGHNDLFGGKGQGEAGGVVNVGCIHDGIEGHSSMSGLCGHFEGGQMPEKNGGNDVSMIRKVMK